MEPMTNVDFPVFCRKLGFHSGVGNLSNKIWVLWKNSISGHVLNDNEQSIDLQFSSSLFPSSFYTSLIYAKSTRVDRRDLWNELRSFAAHSLALPWLVGGFEGCILGVHSNHAPMLFQAFLTTSKPPAAFRVKQKLKLWNRNIFGSIFSNLKQTEDNVQRAETEYDSNPTTNNRANLHHAIAQLVLATKVEEDYWHQKSSCKWVVEGERNTHYFHNLVRKKRIRARIHSISDNGVTLTYDSDIQRSCVTFFSKYLSNDTPTDDLVCHFPFPQIPENTDTNVLYASPSEEEIKQVVFSINPDSAAGPDGFYSHFYQSCWEIIHQDVVLVVQEFFEGAYSS
ncbi:hypothetical protein DH2020_016722 [Rehmannia glutinosa]|uniref:Uncharacterized protein n=1 Tax=Rehmannia glutinosa TaxID=99300 RepID=A0ABR0WP35_REHGL